MPLGVGLSLVVIVGGGWMALVGKRVQELDARVAEADAECRRLDYVLARDQQLREQTAELREQLTAAGENSLPSTPATPQLASWQMAAPAPKPTGGARLPGMRRVHEREASLEELGRRMVHGQRLESGLPAMERHVADLRARSEASRSATPSSP